MSKITKALFLGMLLAAFCSQFPKAALAGPYADSAHGDTSIGVDRSSIDIHYANYVTGNCAHCHEQHASLGGSEPTPTGGPDDYLLFEAMSSNAFCNTCHDGSPVTGDVASQTINFSGHDPATSYVGSSGTVSATCLDCHDPHVAQETTHSEAVDGNTASGVLLNVAGVQATWSSPGTPAAGSETLVAPSYTATDTITKEYELCLKCHSSYAFSSFPAGWTDQGKEFNPYNYSFHPVSEHTSGQQWNNTWLRANYANALWPPWNTLANRDARMHCSDCHGDNAAGTPPKGPHGSNLVYILKATGPVANNYDDLCNMCHRPTNSSAFGNHSRGQHVYPNNRLGCVGCHGGPVGNYGGRRGNIHGTNYRWPSGTAATKFLVGGYNYALTSNSCAASTVTSGVNDGGCKGHPPKGY